MGHHGPTTYFASYALTGLIAFFLFLIPGVEFLQEILGGLITDLDDFITTLPSIAFVNLSNLFYIVETGAEVAIFNAYPIHWTLSYRPDDVWEVALQIIPWLASGAIIGAIFPENPKDALIIGAGTILSAGLNVILLSTLLPNVILPIIPTVGPVIIGGIHRQRKRQLGRIGFQQHILQSQSLAVESCRPRSLPDAQAPITGIELHGIEPQGVGAGF